jgi:hypothetical protein
MNNASLELGGTNWAEKDGNILGYSVGDTSGKYFPQEFTFARGSNLSATRIGKTGLIVKGRENVLLQSNSFDTTWGNVNSAETSGFEGYDGTNNAWKLQSTTIYSSLINQTLTLNGVQTFSVYAKAGTANYLAFYNIASSIPRAWYNLSNGTIESTLNKIDAKIESVGNGWYRCSMTYNQNISEVNVYVSDANNSFSSAIGSSIYIQDAQLELGLAASPYIPTTTTTAQAGVLENTPRLNYTTGVANPYLLIEPQRSNLVDDYSGYTWNSFNGAAISFTGTEQSPEGFNNAVTWTFGGSSGEVVQRSSISISNSTTYTISGYFKLTSGTLTSGSNQIKGLDGLTGVGASLNTLTNEWQRLSFNVTSSSTSGRVQLRCDNSATIQVYGLQLEAGSYKTSIIPTYSVSATRAKDVCIDGGSAKSINSTEGVLYAEISALANDSTQRAITLSDGGNTNRVCLLYNDSSNSIRLFVQVGGSTQASVVSTSYAITDFNKIAIKWKANDFALWINGVEAGTDNTGVSFTSNTLNTLDFRFPNDTTFFYGNVKQVLTFNTALSDAELATLTTI